MLLILPKLLNDEALKKVDAMLSKASFIPGHSTAGPTARQVKNNMQLDRTTSKGAEKVDELIISALWQNVNFRTAVLPRRIKQPLYVKYAQGMSYGTHSDNPVMEGKDPIRTDLSITLFLCEPDQYEGGELAIRTDAGEARVKLPKGDAVVYSTGALHAVKPVTTGERLVAVSWIQSIIADPHRRKIVGELDLVCRSLAHKIPNSEEHNLLSSTYANLVRLWGEV